MISEYPSKELHFCEAHNTINNCASSPLDPSSHLGIADLNNRLSGLERKIVEAAEALEKPCEGLLCCLKGVHVGTGD